jgi:hypothetical protein
MILTFAHWNGNKIQPQSMSILKNVHIHVDYHNCEIFSVGDIWLLESFVETEDSIKMYICITHKQYCDLNTVGNLSALYFPFRELHVF